MSSRILRPSFQNVGKILEYDAHLRTGEPRAFLLDPYFGQQKLIKEASALSDALRFAQTLKSEPGKTYVLVLAVSADEFYGDNRNGDAFAENPIPGFTEPGDELLRHYRSFEDANNFMHHVNKDPEKRVGRVNKSFYNHPMHRVELILRLNNDKAGRVVERIADGEYPAVSMGCKIKHDVCSICKNKAPSRAQYCSHARDYLGQILPGTDKKVKVYNPAPRFFDISWVLRPADRTGYMIKKVAAFGASRPYEIRSSGALAEYVELARHKRAAFRKASDITKIVQGEAIDAQEEGAPLSAQEANQLRQFAKGPAHSILDRMPPIGDDAIEGMAQKFTFPEVLSTLTDAGIVLTTPEFVKLVFHKMMGHVPPEAEALIASIIDNQDQVFDLMAENPNIFDSCLETAPIVPVEENVNPKLAAMIEPWIEKRSQAMEYIKNRLMPSDDRNMEPQLEMLHMVNPETGGVFQTQRGHATQERLRQGKNKLYSTAGSGALLAAAYKILQSAGVQGKMLSPLALAGGGLFALNAATDHAPTFRTIEGESVPATTPFYKVSGLGSFSTLAPLLGSAGMTLAMADDYRFRGWQMEQALAEAKRRGERFQVPWTESARSGLGQMAYEHPLITGTAGALGIRHLLKKVMPKPGAPAGKSSWLKDLWHTAKKKLPKVILIPKLIKRGAFEESFDGIECPAVDFAKLSLDLGEILGDSYRENSLVSPEG